MIILGYPGVGKSTLIRDTQFKNLYNIIDLESSMFKFDDGGRPDKWYEQWCKVAIYLSIQGYTVLGPTHQKIRDYLSNSNYMNCVCIIPDLYLEYRWSDKLWDRFVSSREEKDYNSYARCKNYFKKDISAIKDDYLIKSYTIETLDYSLRNIITNIMVEHDKDKTNKTDN